jgi:hypothetical protein
MVLSDDEYAELRRQIDVWLDEVIDGVATHWGSEIAFSVKARQVVFDYGQEKPGPAEFITITIGSGRRVMEDAHSRSLRRCEPFMSKG